MPGLDWSDAEEIAERLARRDPQTCPLEVRFTDLRDRVLQLEGFTGPSDQSSEARLEAVQMAWQELWQDENK
jgi:FeS assembly protein IscX